jgi:redox-sensitive bicupin YhaK (pirin superfamily)
MIDIRKADARGHADHGWLRTWHTFSFADYHDPAHVHFRGLRVLNEDIVAPGTGFGMHPHRDMEILTYVLSGKLEHRDDMGNGSTIGPGEVQVMSAGTGVVHGERNPSPTEAVHLLQIWIFPTRKGLPPRYAQADVAARLEDALCRIAAPPGEGGAVDLFAGAAVHAGRLAAGRRVEHRPAAGRASWVQVARGELTLDGASLAAGDGAAVTGSAVLRLTAGAQGAEVLVFDLD